MNITEAIDKVFNLVDKIVESTKEESPGGKKITLPEAIGIGVKTIGVIPAITAFAQLKADWQSRDEVKRAQWLAAFNERFDLANDELEEQIEKAVEALLMIEGVVNKLNPEVPPPPR